MTSLDLGSDIILDRLLVRIERTGAEIDKALADLIEEIGRIRERLEAVPEDQPPLTPAQRSRLRALMNGRNE